MKKIKLWALRFVGRRFAHTNNKLGVSIFNYCFDKYLEIKSPELWEAINDNQKK